ncbi:MAG: hypothetical protein SGILL_002191, partial [Bacillariaceae sp.]
EEFDAGLEIDDEDDDHCDSKEQNRTLEHVAEDDGNSSDDDSATIRITHHSNKCVVRVERQVEGASPSMEGRTKPNSPQPSGEAGQKRTASILKPETKSEPLYINNHRRSWRSLPQADLESILQQVTAPSSDSEESEQKHSTRPQPNPQRRHSVGFDSIEIRFYAQTVGDNPSCSYGTPIQLDWDYEQCDGVAVDEYETSRGKRRDLRQMVLSYYHRRNILSWQYGVSEDELKTAQKQADKIKMKRTITRTFLPAMPFESVMERASRKAKQLVKSKQ